MVARGALPAGLFEQAVALHQGGQLAPAEQLYRQVLALVPEHAEALHLLGLLAHQAGQSAVGLPLIEHAIRLRPRAAAYHDSRGQALKTLGRLDEAIDAFRRAVRLDAQSFGAHYNLGNAYLAAERGEEAAKCYRRALLLNPNSVGAWNNLGDVCRRLQKLKEAAEAFRAALRLEPGAPELHFNVGRVLFEDRQFAAAEASFAEVVRLQPEHGAAHNMRGQALDRLGRFEAAIASHREAVRLMPGNILILNDLGVSLEMSYRFAEAESVFRTALRLAPNLADAHCNLGNHFLNAGRLEEAASCLAEALRLNPNHASAHSNLAVLYLVSGRYREGWEEAEWRWEAERFKRRFETPPWAGEPSVGRVLLVHEEQGVGDYIQFCRFVPLAAERARLRLRVPRSLQRLLRTLGGPWEAIVPRDGGAAPDFDLHCPILSLPRALGITLDNLPPAPYLRAEPAPVAAWRERLASLPGRHVGLAWAGNPDYPNDRGRSLAGGALAALAGTPGVAFVSLQIGGAPWTALSTEQRAALNLQDWTAELTDFADTAALIAALDLVVSVDTSIAHLAGALGHPVWLLNRFDTDWRWLREREDSPWYPSLRIFRQEQPGDWDGVLARVRAALALTLPQTLTLPH
jgi:tetratricopeptide (TPR) repeat protein